jgi:hypothetical protein
MTCSSIPASRIRLRRPQPLLAQR